MARPIVMPSLGMYTAEGTLTTWLREPGATVAAGEPVAEITTEKATYEIEAPQGGILHAVAAVGADLPVQAVIGYILAPGETPPTEGLGAGGWGLAVGQPSPSPARPSPAPHSPPTSPAPASASPQAPSSPIARRLAAQHGIDLATLTGSGPGGRIVEADVLAAVARRGGGAEEPGGAAAGERESSSAPPLLRSSAPPPAERRVRQRIPLAGLRRTIAERLRHSLATAAPVTLTREADAEALVAAREALAERLGRSIPYDALFVKLFAAALRERPELNAVIEDDAILVLDEVHVGFAVSVPNGLVVPVIHDADAAPLGEVVTRMAELGERARAGQVRPADIAGGTATITNLGAFGVDAFTPILNPPQAAILGIGRIQSRPVWLDGRWVARRRCVLSLTFDHRVADGVPAAQLLDVVARLMADAAYLDGLA